MKTNVIVKLQFEGLHHWPGVVEHKELEEVHFLSALHRHIFHVTAKKEVTHDDRDVEIIKLKRNIQEYLNRRYWTEGANCHHLGAMSCEMLAKELAKFFGLNYCEVLEDGENGAEYIQDEITMTEEVIDDSESIVDEPTMRGYTISYRPDGYIVTYTTDPNQLKFPF